MLVTHYANITISLNYTILFVMQFDIDTTHCEFRTYLMKSVLYFICVKCPDLK